MHLRLWEYYGTKVEQKPGSGQWFVFDHPGIAYPERNFAINIARIKHRNPELELDVEIEEEMNSIHAITEYGDF